MTYDIFHETTFDYFGPVTFSHNIARLHPRDDGEQTLESFRLEIVPEATEVQTFDDMFGNTNHHLLLRESHTTLRVTGHSRIARHGDVVRDALARLRGQRITYAQALTRLGRFALEDVEAKQFLFPSELIPVGAGPLRDYALASFRPDRSLAEAGEELMMRIFEDFEFVSGFSDLSTPVATIFEARKGVCQDFAHLGIAALRSLGLPARYVSGYIETLPPEGQEKLFGADASHAWLSLYIPGAGWLDLDPTNNMIPAEQHVVLGYGRDYDDISPLKGVVRSSGESRLSVRVDVRRVEAPPAPVQIASQSQSQW